MTKLPARALRALKIINDYGSIHLYKICLILDMHQDNSMQYHVRKLLKLGLIKYDTENFQVKAKPLKINPDKKEEVNRIIQGEVDFWTNNSTEAVS